MSNITLQESISSILLALAGQTLEQPVVIQESHLDPEAVDEFKNFNAFFGTDKWLQIYQGKDAIMATYPTITLDVSTGKIIVAHSDGFTEVSVSQVSVSSQGSTLNIQGSLEGTQDEYYSLNLRASVVEGFEGVAPIAALKNKTSTILAASGSRICNSSSKLLAVVHRVLKAGTDDEYAYTVLRTETHQFRIYQKNGEFAKSLEALIGTILTIQDGTLVCGEFTWSSGGFIDLENLPDGSYQIKGHETRVSKKGFPYVLVELPQGKLAVKKMIGAEIVNNFTGDNMLLHKLGTVVSVSTIGAKSDSIRDRFAGLMKAPAPEQAEV